MINIYDIRNTNYTKNGDATLQPIRCDIILNINGGWSLELEVPYDKDGEYQVTVLGNPATYVTKVGKWNLIQEGAVIRVDMDCLRVASSRQLFRIYDYKRTLTSVVAIAYPIAMECSNDVLIEDLALTNLTGVDAVVAIQNYINTSKYTLASNITKSGTTSFSHINLCQALASGEEGSFIDVWGGEVLWDNFTIRMLEKLGDQNNSSKYPVIYGRNITGINYERDDSGVVTRIYPISKDGVKLNGNGYVDSPIIGYYPYIHKRYLPAPYELVIDKETDNSATASLTRTALAAIKAESKTASHNLTISLISGSPRIPIEYISKLKSSNENQKGIVEAVQDMVTAEIYHTELKSKAKSYIKEGLNDSGGAFDVPDKYKEKNWTWHEDTSVEPYAWWYGYDAQGVGESVFAKNEYIKIGKYYEYFNNDGYWEEYKRLPSVDLYQNSDGSWSIGYREGYYAHDEYVYMTVEGQMKEWWYDSDGWYDDASSGDSDFGWHGDSSTGIWFGEEDAGTEDKSKYLHDCWAFIDGTYYFFDQYGYTDADPVHSLPDYPWGSQVDEKTGKEWFGNTDKSVGAKWLYNQWIKIDGDYWFVDANGYVRDEDISFNTVVGLYTTGLTSIKTVCNTQQTALYNLLYQLMTTWCNQQYSDGIDKPTLNLSVDIVDLSKTSDYAGREYLEKICLGDKVDCRDARHDIYSTERVLGLTYDAIRGCNKAVVIGHTENTLGSVLSTNSGNPVPAGFDTSAITSALTTQGNAIAALQSGKQDKLRAGDNITIDSNNVISATGGAGLQYWHETPTRFYREGTHEGLTADAHVYNTGFWTNFIGGLSNGFEYRKINNEDALMGWFGIALNKAICLVSSESANAVKWQFRSRGSSDAWQDMSAYSTYSDKMWTTSFEYNNTTWYMSVIGVFNGSSTGGTVDGLDFIDQTITYNNEASAIELSKHFIDVTHAKESMDVVVEVSTESYCFRYGGATKNFVAIDIDGNAVFKEITTDAGTLSQQMASKQNLLTAGANVQINGDTISATDTTYDEFDGDSAGLVPAVQTQSGKVLSDDGTWVDVGTSVEANPSDSATSTLLKLKVDGTTYGISGGGGGGGSFVGLTKSQYDALPTSEKEDTSKLYFVQEGGGQIETTDLIGVSSDWGMYREGSMTITWNNDDEIVFDWVGGSSIGGDIVKKVAIPANASKIRFKITTGSAYSTTVQRFKLGIGVRTTYTTNVVLDGYNVSDWLAFKNFDTTNSVWEDELDLSNVTVDTYLYIIAHGWDATVNKLEMDVTDGSEATYHTYWNNAKRAQWNQIKELTQSEYDELSLTEKQNGTVYMTHDDGGSYEFVSYDNGKIVVRVDQTTGQTLWFFNGFYKDATDLSIPTELTPYLPTRTATTRVMQAKSWTDDTSTTTNGWIGFLDQGTANVKLRSWTPNFQQLQAGTFWAVLDIDGSTAEGGQTAPYSSPYDGVGNIPNRIYYNNTLYAEKKPSNQITYGTTTPTGDANDGDLYILLDNNNEKQGEYLFIGSAWVQIE